MRSTFSLLPYINRSKVKADGTTAVMCRITIDGRSTAITTGIYCRPEDWNAKTGTTRTVRENARLQEYRKYIEQTYEDILRTQGIVSAEIIKTRVTRQFVVPTHLLQMGEIERERLRIRSKEINSISTYRHSRYFQKYLTDYLTSLGRKDIAFEEITEDFGKGYKAFLVRNKNFSSTQTNRCLCWLNRLLYLAVDNEILRTNPVEDVEYEKKPAPRHKYVTREEMKRIMAMPLNDGRAELGRRAFIFSCLTGLAYADIKQLHPRHIETTADGRRFIRINRKKTGVEAVIPLHPIAEQILALYNTTDMHNLVFPLPSRDSIWHEIREIGVILGRNDDLSYHQARHGFGVLLISESVSIESIAKMMGHSNISTTQGYARITEDKISKEMDKLMEKRSKHRTHSGHDNQ